MNCEFNYCFYNKEHTCILDEIQIDLFGMFASCEFIDVSKKIKKIWLGKNQKIVEAL